MSPSSGASTPSSAKYKSLVAVVDAPAMRAIRQALPVAFGALLVVTAILFTWVPATGFSGRFFGAFTAGFAPMGLVLVARLTWSFARTCGVERIATTLVAIAVFLLTFPEPAGESWLRYLAQSGRSAIFLGIAIGLVVPACVRLARLALKNEIAAHALAFAALFAVMVPLAMTHWSLATAIAAVMEPLGRLGDSYVALLVITILETGLWLVGIHGPAFLMPIVTPVYLDLVRQNALAASAHEPVTHVVTISTFLFVFPGGAGATLPLALYLLKSRVARLRKLSRLTILPALCNINDPLIFGVPLTWNPVFAVPFVAVPAVLATTTYLAMTWGWVAKPLWYVPSGVPTVVATVLATNDWRAAILAIVNIAIAAVVYWPFFHAYERHLTAEVAEPPVPRRAASA